MTGQIEALGNVMYKEEGQECKGQGITTTRVPHPNNSFFPEFLCMTKSKYAVSAER